MREGTDKREHSAKPEVDDLTDYQSLNSLGGAGVARETNETPDYSSPEQEPIASEQEPKVSSKSEPTIGIKYSGDYNDGADFTTVDNKGQTNA
jgi:hypothetical protein